MWEQVIRLWEALDSSCGSEENSTAAGGASGCDIAPGIAHEKGICEGDGPVARGTVKQPGERLAAVATVGVVVRTGVDGVHRHVRTEDVMHPFEFVWC
jgi:hypothetical protein